MGTCFARLGMTTSYAALIGACLALMNITPAAAQNRTPSVQLETIKPGYDGYEFSTSAERQHELIRAARCRIEEGEDTFTRNFRVIVADATCILTVTRNGEPSNQVMAYRVSGTWYFHVDLRAHLRAAFAQRQIPWPYGP